MAQSTKKASLYLFVLRLVRMAITVITVTFSAKYFGVSMEKDIWVLTLTIITTLVTAVFGPLNDIFRTKFVFIREQDGEEKALDKTSSLVGFVFWVTIVLGAILFFGADYFAGIMTENMQQGAAALFVSLLMLQIPSLMFNELTNIGISILNAYDVYYIPEIVGFLGGIVNLAAIIFLAPSWGIYSLLVGTYFGILVLFFVVAYFLHKKKLAVWNRLCRFKWADVWVFIVFALPFFFPYFVGQINTFVEKYISGMLGSGMISSVEYSRQFISVLQNVLTSVFTTIMVPVLSKQFINRCREDFNKTIIDNLMIGMLIYGVASVFMIGSATPLCDFFFNRGKVSPEALEMIITLTQYYAVAFLGILLYIITGLAMLASDQRKYYATLGVLTQIVVLAVNYFGSRQFGVYIFPVSLGAVHLCAGALMFVHNAQLQRRAILKYLLRATLSLAVIIAAVYAANHAFSYDKAFLRLVEVGASLVAVVPLMAYMLGFNVKAYAQKAISKIYKNQ